jgi:cell filamentation protein
MKRKSGVKYIASGVDEFQPGSDGKVLRNKLGIASKKEMNDLEIIEYQKAAIRLASAYTKDHRMTENDIKKIHKIIFGRLYNWAGTYRNVELSKAEFVFARAKFIGELMKQFSKEVLESLTPPKVKTDSELAILLAKIHVEFILIHPFREGNGRTIRLLLHLITQQAGYKGMDFSFINEKGKTFDRYVRSIHAGMKGDYEPMARIMRRAIT